MALFIGGFFRSIMYVFFGLFMELLSTIVYNLTDGNITKQDEKLIGRVSFFMIPVYGILLLFVFEFVNGLFPNPTVYHSIINGYWYFIFIKYITYCLSITSFEILSGWIYDKYFKVRPWDYSGQKGAIINGYTKIQLFFMWGIMGLILEFYTYFLKHIDYSIVKFFLG